MSALPRDIAESRARSIIFHRFTPSTITSLHDLMAELADIRAEGLAFDREEHETGIHCIAAPIQSADRHFVAGLSETSPCYRNSMDEMMTWANDIRTTAHNISDDINTRMGPRSS